MKIVEVYTDGACSNHGATKGQGGAGVLIKWKEATEIEWEEEKHISYGFSSTTSNRMELVGMISALIYLYNFKEEILEVNIYSDSKYTINIINKCWYLNWETTDYYNKKNVDLIRDHYIPLYLALKANTEKIKINHVRGHTGIEGNEIADTLANEGKNKSDIHKLVDNYLDKGKNEKTSLSLFLNYLNKECEENF